MDLINNGAKEKCCDKGTISLEISLSTKNVLEFVLTKLPKPVPLSITLIIYIEN